MTHGLTIAVAGGQVSSETSIAVAALAAMAATAAMAAMAAMAALAALAWLARNAHVLTGFESRTVNRCMQS